MDLGDLIRELTTDSAAWYLGVTRQTIWRWRKRGLLAGYLIESKWWVSVQELESLKKRVAARRRRQARPTFRDFATKVLGCSRVGLWALERRLEVKITPEVLAQVLLEEGRKQGRAEMYQQLRQQRRLRYPKMAEAAKQRYKAAKLSKGG